MKLQYEKTGKISNFDQIKKSLKLIKYPFALISSLYLTANLTKPIISQAIIEYSFKNNEITNAIEREKFGFPTNEIVGTTKSNYFEDYSYKTYLSKNGHSVKYIESINKSTEAFNGKNNVLFVFVGIDNNTPRINHNLFEKVVHIYYDTKKLSKQDITKHSKAVSEMIKTNYGQYKLSMFSTSFGSMFSSFLDNDLKFNNCIAYAPFVGESELVKEITGLPIPISLFWSDQYNNFITNPRQNTKVIIGSRDGLTGGIDILKRTYSSVTTVKDFNHMGYNATKPIFDEFNDKLQINFKLDDKLNNLTESEKSEMFVYFEYNKKTQENFNQFIYECESIEKDLISELFQDFIAKHPDFENKSNKFSNTTFLLYASLKPKIRIAALKYLRKQILIDKNFQKIKPLQNAPSTFR